jgi:hypothetical protein
MSPTVWGPPIWTLFHTLAEKVKEDKFNPVGLQLFAFIKKICRYLPCPDCSEHATTFLSKINNSNLKSRKDLINMLYFFHNTVNTRKKKPIHNPPVLLKYKEIGVIQAYNNFISVYKTKGNMKLLADTFQRQIIISDFKKWLISNLIHFESNSITQQ